MNKILLAACVALTAAQARAYSAKTYGVKTEKSGQGTHGVQGGDAEANTGYGAGAGLGGNSATSASPLGAPGGGGGAGAGGDSAGSGGGGSSNSFDNDEDAPDAPGSGGGKAPTLVKVSSDSYRDSLRLIESWKPKFAQLRYDPEHPSTNPPPEWQLSVKTAKLAGIWRKADGKMTGEPQQPAITVEESENHALAAAEVPQTPATFFKTISGLTKQASRRADKAAVVLANARRCLKNSKAVDHGNYYMVPSACVARRQKIEDLALKINESVEAVVPYIDKYGPAIAAALPLTSPKDNGKDACVDPTPANGKTGNLAPCQAAFVEHSMTVKQIQAAVAAKWEEEAPASGSGLGQ